MQTFQDEKAIFALICNPVILFDGHNQVRMTKLLNLLIIILFGPLHLIPSSFACLRYVPDVYDQDLEIFPPAKPRPLELDCECGKPKDEFSWIVKITHEFLDSDPCWGSIINDLFVVTSAKCLVEYKSLTMRDNVLIPTQFDMNNIKLQTIETNVIDLTPKAVHCHPRAIPTYVTQKDIDYDVCIIELDQRINFKDDQKKLSPVCIPDLKELTKTFVGQRGVIHLDDDNSTLTSSEEHQHLDQKNESWIFTAKKCGRSNDRILCTQFDESPHNVFSFGTTGSPVMILLKSDQMLQVGIFSDTDIRETRGDSPYLTSLVEFSTNLGNEEIMSFINKKSEISGAKWCKSKHPFVDDMHPVSKDFPQNPASHAITFPWEGFTSTHRKTITRCNCGIRHSLVKQGRIVNGQEAKRNEYPWQVQIVSRKNKNTNELCGGSLINSKLVLTAAHCVASFDTGVIAKADKVTVRFRRHEGFNADADEDDIASVKTVIVHPGFIKKKDFSDDIALLELQKPVTFSTESKLFPVCIPKAEEFGTDNVKLIGQKGTVIGWGYTSPSVDDSHTLAGTLQELTVPIRTREECNAAISYRMQIPKTICASNLNLKSEYKDPSHGDSGGPLMVSVQSKKEVHELVQVGIVSVGTWQAAENYERPAVWFTSVQDQLSFIDYYSFKVGGIWCSR